MLSPAKYKVIKALLQSRTLEDAAKTSGLTVRTIQNYLDDAEFVQEYEAAVENMIGDATHEASKGISEAILNLRRLLDSEVIEPRDRISAARALLEYGLKLIEIHDILRRIEKLEGASDNVCSAKKPYRPA